MTVSVTIDDLDADIVARLQAEADRRGIDVSAVVKELLSKELGLAGKDVAGPPYRDLDALAGTWSQGEVDAFLAATADFGRVDEELWK